MRLTTVELDQKIVSRDALIEELEIALLEYSGRINSLEVTLDNERLERVKLRHRVGCIEPENLNCQCPQACDGFND